MVLVEPKSSFIPWLRVTRSRHLKLKDSWFLVSLSGNEKKALVANVKDRLIYQDETTKQKWSFQFTFLPQ